MDLYAEIVSGTSIGGVSLGESIQDTLRNLQAQSADFRETAFENLGGCFRQIHVAGGVLSIVADGTDRVVRLWCTPGYLGSYRGAFRPGMTIEDICKRSHRQLILHGFLLLDGDFGAGFSIPDRYEGQCFDDVDFIEQLPRTMVLTELHVMEPEWWR